MSNEQRTYTETLTITGSAWPDGQHTFSIVWKRDEYGIAFDIYGDPDRTYYIRGDGQIECQRHDKGSEIEEVISKGVRCYLVALVNLAHGMSLVPAASNKAAHAAWEQQPKEDDTR